MNESDYEIDYDTPCPDCGNEFIHYRDCSNIFCEDGYIDEYNNDPINFMPGESEEVCEDCKGTGIEHWCPKCGANLSGRLKDDDQS